jgi:HlyD family secretion protein
MKKRMGFIVVGGVLACAGAAAWFMGAGASPADGQASARRDTAGAQQAYLTQAVDRGTVRRSINISGTLTPVNLVQVGTSVSGTVLRLHSDFNAPVKAGQLLAELDPALLEADLAQADAQVRSAQASLTLASSRLVRVQSLVSQGFSAPAEADEAAAEVATAQATLALHQAAVQRAQRNRRNAEIRSPVAGTVVSREVSVGQTVAASLQTPVLFKIAQDLREMQIETAVSEADVGLLREGLKVSFTVDAFPERRFEGTVHQIRNNYSVQQNVVTYTAIVRTRNDDLALRPGMTGYVAVAVAERIGVLRIPNAALRYEPAAAGAGAGASAAAPSTTAPANRKTVWRLTPAGSTEAVTVLLGVADGRFTEVTSGLLKEGDALVIGERGAGDSFGPKIF